MITILLSAVVTCTISLFLGQAALRLAGAREWNWLAPPIGISLGMLVAVPAIHLPGRCATVAVLLGGLSIGAIAWCGSSPAHRPPVAGLLTASPVALLVLVPFLAVGHEGILGTSLNNDMAAHLSFVEAYLSSAAWDITPPVADYPLGPHAMVAVIAKGGGVRADQAFTGWTMALPILNAWMVLALVHRASWFKQMIAATVVGIPFLIAAYYGQGAFKEVLQAGLVLATALLLSGCGPTLGRGRWVPLALLVAGMMSVYSVTGLPWPLLLLGFWVIGTAVLRVTSCGLKGLGKAISRELPALGIGCAVFLTILLPQLPRIARFISERREVNGTGIPKDSLGNLASALPGWEAFGVWNNPDFRLPASPAFTGGMWTAFVLALVLFGVVWAIRSGRWMLPLAAAGSMLIWVMSAHSQAPYVAAKALVIVSPLLLVLAVLPLVEHKGKPPTMSSIRELRLGQSLSWGLASCLALVLFVRVGVSDVQALRVSPVGPTDHVKELHALRPLLHGQPTLFLGNDDYIRWELATIPAQAPVVGFQELPIRQGKAWVYGKAHDFDSVDADTLNSYEWIITTRDAAGSDPPPAVRLVQTTPNFALWHRVEKVSHRSILAEGEMPGALLDCDAAEGRAVLRGGGVAAVRAAPVAVPGLVLGPGGAVSVQLPLTPGRWWLSASYVSRLPIEATGPGLRATVPPSLDRPGPRWPVGVLTVPRASPTLVTFSLDDPILAPGIPLAEITSIVATPEGASRIVPVHRACGRYVDWYKSVNR